MPVIRTPVSGVAVCETTGLWLSGEKVKMVGCCEKITVDAGKCMDAERSSMCIYALHGTAYDLR